MSPRMRFAVWVLLVVLLLPGQMVWLWLLRGRGLIDRDMLLVAGWMGLGAACVAMLALLRTTPVDAIRLRPRVSRWVVVGGCALLQAMSLVVLSPLLSDDLLRYRLDGRLWLEGRSPYALSPAEYVIADLPTLDGADALVPHGDLHTIYPPTAQGAFVAARAIEDALIGAVPAMGAWRPGAAELPLIHRALPLRAMAGLAAVVTTWLLVNWLVRRGLSPWYAAVFAFSPLTTIECAGMAHIDALGVMLLVAALTMGVSRPALAGALAVLAAGVKPHAILALPLLLRRRAVSAWLPAVVVGLLMTVPLLIDGGWSGFSKTASTYAAEWEANGSIYELFKATAGGDDHAMVDAKESARRVAMVVPLLLAMWGYLRRWESVRLIHLVFLALVLTSPVVYPWYLLWMTALVPVLAGGATEPGPRSDSGPGGLVGGPAPVYTTLTLAATVSLSYLLWRTRDWVMRPGWLLIEYVPVYAVLAAELLRAAWPGRSRVRE